MAGRRNQPGRLVLYFLTFFWLAVVVPLGVAAAPYAAIVMDARNGQILHSRNADTRLHPASLTKMMTLYIAFQAVQNGEISMDSLVRISANAAAEPPSRLGLRKGQRIKLRYLVRAAAVKSANDAATAIGEAIEGSEAAFARRMNRTAKALGMRRTTFKNANGLTTPGHLSTARDMAILGRHLLYDYPQYYNLFSRRSTDAGLRKVSNTNRRFLDAYKGADGIKTGYTRAAGFNLVASAERGSERIIVAVFGGRSTAWRNAKVAELMDLGFRRAPTRVAFRKPQKPPYRGKDEVVITRNEAPKTRTRAKSIRVASAAVTKSLRPVARRASEPALPDALVAELKDGIAEAIEQVQEAAAEDVAAAESNPGKSLEPAPEETAAASQVAKGPVAPSLSVKPVERPEDLVLASAEVVPPELAEISEPQPQEPVLVTRISTSGGHQWGVNVGRFPNRYEAQKALLKTALTEMATLDGALRKIVNRKGGYDATFMGLSRERADLACRRLQARQMSCFMIGPS